MSVVPYRTGLVNTSVCADAELTAAQVAEEVNLAHPTGIASPWRISEGETFSGGQPMPCVCEHDPSRRHWLLSC